MKEILSLTPVCPNCLRINSKYTETIGHTPHFRICKCNECGRTFQIVKKFSVFDRS